MNEKGIIAGCDQNQEWLLPWWWEHYSAYNPYPVAFADYGMSAHSAAWCRERGLYFKAPQIERTAKEEIPLEKKELWEDHYGDGIWFHRERCLQKPFVLLASPFSLSIWLDLDCRVRGNLEPLFELLKNGAEIGMRKEPEQVQETHKKKGFLLPHEVNYNSGVIPFRKEAKILRDWVSQIRENSGEFIFDQHAFSRAIRLHQTSVAELPPIYNWSPGDGSNSEALIYHFHGAFLKDPALMYFFS